MPTYEIGRITTYYETAIIDAESAEEAVIKAKDIDCEFPDYHIFGHPTIDTEYLLLTEDVDGN